MTEIILVMNVHLTKSHTKLIYGQINVNDPNYTEKGNFLVILATCWTFGGLFFRPGSP